MPEPRLTHDPFGFACNVKDTDPIQIVRSRELVGDVGSQFAVAQLHVEDGDVRVMQTRQRNRLRHVACNARYVMTQIDKPLSQEIGQHNVVFSNDNLHLKPFLRNSVQFTGSKSGMPLHDE